LEAATQHITAKIQQENEKGSGRLTQTLHNEVKKLSSDNTLRNDTENKIQGLSRTIGGVSERIDTHLLATS
jgi:hypothetical protein